MFKEVSVHQRLFYFPAERTRPDGDVRPVQHYCVSDILTCTPALVFTIGALDDIYGLTRR